MKRFIAFTMASAMLTSTASLGSLPSTRDQAVVDAIPISAEITPTAINAKEPTKDALESAIKAIKAKVTIPKEYSEFDYYFYHTVSYDEYQWSLTWRNPNSSSFIEVVADQDNHIIHYRKYDYSEDRNSIPKYLKKELLGTAEQFLKKIAPEVALKSTYKDATYEGIYSGNYIYHFERKENGIDFPDNTVRIGVNSVTGDVELASIEWLYDAKVPSSKGTITKEEATKLIKDNMSMKLVYRSNYNRIFIDDGGKQKKEAYLVYEPTENYIAIDTKTGEVYLSRVEWQDENSRAEDQKTDGKESSADMAVGASNMLTEEEVKKLEELKNLISKEDAIKKVTSNKYLYLDKNLEVRSATLNKSYYNNEDSYVWNISLNDPRAIDYEKETDHYRAYASAQVDAKTGKIVSFYSSMNNYYDEASGKWNEVKIKYDKEQAREVLEKFLKAENSNRFNKSKLASESNDFVAYYKNDVPVYAGYRYNYNRINEGIEYPYNSIYGSVDGISGKIYSYGYYWDEDIVFESPKGVISAEKAMDHYLSKDGYGLKYEINTVNTNHSRLVGGYQPSYTSQNQIRLVYRPDVSPAFISPFTGEQLNYNGEVYKGAKPYVYKDVSETAENREILLLADMNIGFEGDYFYPEKDITIGEINSLLSGVGYGRQVNITNDDQKLITKEELAMNLIRELGLEKVANLSRIFQTGYADEHAINEKYLGAVALSKGLGIMEAEAGNMFNPKENVSRGEAVHYILKFLEVRREGVYW
ncbi:MAG: hypothetical protein GX359_08095 [Clostridiales bacterium]|nr:hypothetical protein [Clostridiales bacterium]